MLNQDDMRQTMFDHIRKQESKLRFDKQTTIGRLFSMVKLFLLYISFAVHRGLHILFSPGQKSFALFHEKPNHGAWPAPYIRHLYFKRGLRLFSLTSLVSVFTAVAVVYSALNLIFPAGQTPAAFALNKTYTVSSSADSGAKTLRKAIVDANSAEGLDTVELDIPGSTITLASNLPQITSPVKISNEGAGESKLIINGSALPSGVPCINLNNGSSGSTIEGIAFVDCPIGIRVDGVVTGINIGNTTDSKTVTTQNGSIGIMISEEASGNTLSNISVSNATFPAIQVQGDSNTITGVTVTDNVEAGIQLEGNVNTITDSTISDNLKSGITIFGNSNTIGGASTEYKNIISGNGQNGVLVNSGTEDNTVQNNLIGVNEDTTINGNQIGVYVNGATRTTVSGNTVSGSTGTGILATGAVESVTISGNTLNYGQTDGIQIQESPSETIVTISSNTISNNGVSGASVASGIMLLNVEAATVADNVIDSNTSNGIEFNTSSNVTIRGNQITNNTSSGISVLQSNSNTFIGNYIGVTADNTLAGNGNTGMNFAGASSENIVGGTTDEDINYIGDNELDGVYLEADAGLGNSITGNVIGQTPNGATAGNQLSGVNINADSTVVSSNHIGYNELHGVLVGSSEEAIVSNNTIMSNALNGIEIAENAVKPVITGNYIGTNNLGDDLGNNLNGIRSFGAFGARIGGSLTDSYSAKNRNTIRFNEENGILLEDTAVGNIISQNMITDNGDNEILLEEGANGGITAPTDVVATTAQISGTGGEDSGYVQAYVNGAYLAQTSVTGDTWSIQSSAFITRIQPATGVTIQGISVGDLVRVINIDSDDNTSVFSSAVKVTKASSTVSVNYLAEGLEDSIILNVTTTPATTLTVEYGTTSSLGKTEESTTLATEHTVTLGQLETRTKYYYQITATAADGSTTTTSVDSMRTSTIAADYLESPGATVTINEQEVHPGIRLFIEPQTALKVVVADVPTEHEVRLIVDDENGKEVVIGEWKNENARSEVKESFDKDYFAKNEIYTLEGQSRLEEKPAKRSSSIEIVDFTPTRKAPISNLPAYIVTTKPQSIEFSGDTNNLHAQARIFDSSGAVVAVCSKKKDENSCSLPFALAAGAQYTAHFETLKDHLPSAPDTTLIIVPKAVFTTVLNTNEADSTFYTHRTLKQGSTFKVAGLLPTAKHTAEIFIDGTAVGTGTNSGVSWKSDELNVKTLGLQNSDHLLVVKYFKGDIITKVDEYPFAVRNVVDLLIGDIPVEVEQNYDLTVKVTGGAYDIVRFHHNADVATGQITPTNRGDLTGSVEMTVPTDEVGTVQGYFQAQNSEDYKGKIYTVEYNVVSQGTLSSDGEDDTADTTSGSSTDQDTDAPDTDADVDSDEEGKDTSTGDVDTDADTDTGVDTDTGTTKGDGGTDTDADTTTDADGDGETPTDTEPTPGTDTNTNTDTDTDAGSGTPDAGDSSPSPVTDEDVIVLSDENSRLQLIQIVVKSMELLTEQEAAVLVTDPDAAAIIKAILDERNALTAVTLKEKVRLPSGKVVEREVEQDTDAALQITKHTAVGLVSIQRLKFFSTPESEKPKLYGISRPYADVKVTYYSDPIVRVTRADANGKWTMTVPTDLLPEGEHAAEVQTTSQGVQSDQVEIAKFVVIEERHLSNTTWLFIINMSVAIVLLVLVLAMQIRHKNHPGSFRSSRLPRSQSSKTTVRRSLSARTKGKQPPSSAGSSSDDSNDDDDSNYHSALGV